MFGHIIEAIDNFLWGWTLIILLFGTHLFMTIRTGFIQKNIFKAINLSVTKDKGAAGDVSQFGALTTALSSTIGTANIIGVGTAIALGGPGAVLVGSIVELNLVWSLADILNGLMAVPNIIAVLFLSGVIVKETKKYKGPHLDDFDSTEIPVIKNATSGVLTRHKS